MLQPTSSAGGFRSYEDMYCVLSRTCRAPPGDRLTSSVNRDGAALDRCVYHQAVCVTTVQLAACHRALLLGGVPAASELSRRSAGRTLLVRFGSSAWFGSFLGRGGICKYVKLPFVVPCVWCAYQTHVTRSVPRFEKKAALWVDGRRNSRPSAVSLHVFRRRLSDRLAGRLAYLCRWH